MEEEDRQQRLKQRKRFGVSFIFCLVWFWSGLLWSALLSFLHTHTHIHTCICVCFLSVSLCENRKEKKKLLNPWMIWDAHMNLSSLSLHKYVSRGIYTFYWRTNQLYYLHNFDKYLQFYYSFKSFLYLMYLFIFIQVNVAVRHRSITMQTFTNDYRLLESIIHCTVYTYICISLLQPIQLARHLAISSLSSLFAVFCNKLQLSWEIPGLLFHAQTQRSVIVSLSSEFTIDR